MKSQVHIGDALIMPGANSSVSAVRLQFNHPGSMLMPGENEVLVSNMLFYPNGVNRE